MPALVYIFSFIFNYLIVFRRCGMVSHRNSINQYKRHRHSAGARAAEERAGNQPDVGNRGENRRWQV
jgi:hypothetical protein